MKLKSLVKLGVATAIVGILFTGCGTTVSPPKINKIINKNNDINIKIKINGLTKNDYITSNEISSAIRTRIFNTSKYKIYSKSPYRSYTYEGLEVFQNNTNINLQYSKNRFKGKSVKKGNTKYKIIKTTDIVDNNTIVNLKYPNSYVINETKYDDGFGGTNYYRVDTAEELQKDFDNIYKSLNKPYTITVNRKYIKKGEINTKYDDKSIYANFERMLGKYNWRSWKRLSNNNVSVNDIKKENTFALKLNNIIFPINITVYPYRGGSKVSYTAYVPYTINTKTGASITMKSIDSINTLIEKIINN